MGLAIGVGGERNSAMLEALVSEPEPNPLSTQADCEVHGVIMLVACASWLMHLGHQWQMLLVSCIG
jgi:hypothetical protein